jgi:hypothetical protein
MTRRPYDSGRREGRWDRQVIAPEEERRIQSGIDSVMRAVIADRHYDPIHALDKRLDGSHIPMVKVTPVGAPVVKEPGVPEWKGLAEPWKSRHPQQDWLRLGSSVAQANVESAEAALAKLGEEKSD